MRELPHFCLVMPAKAGIQVVEGTERHGWTPAFAGATLSRHAGESRHPSCARHIGSE